MDSQPLTCFLEAVPDASLVVDAGGVIRVANERADAMFGFENGALVGARLESLLPTTARGRHADHFEGFMKGAAVRAMGKGQHYSGLRRDGSEFAVDISLSPVEVDGEPHVLSVIRDVSKYRRTNFGEIIGGSQPVQCLLSQLAAVAPTTADVLVVGESGVGKELIARALHNRSRRNKGPLVKVNCASIPRELFESEFFGHVKGAFTGAVGDRKGRFEVADGGTLFLDEVGEIPIDLQSKLLRVLQEREFEPVGDHRTVKVDVRVVAATNRDLAAEVEAGRFREDLYYRLNVFPIRVPPLRERGEDVVGLAEYFLGKSAERLGVPRASITEADRQAMLRHDWPGNVRELGNVIERALILSVQNGGVLALDKVIRAQVSETPWRQDGQLEHHVPDPSRIWTAAELKGFERSNIERALAEAGGRIGGPGGAAELLGMTRTTLASRIKSLEIVRPTSDAAGPANDAA